jgi:glyoxylase-like metal-dependent hydrolase (beta-lactamase superfamily II)
MTNPATLIVGFLTIVLLGGFSSAQPQPTPLAAAQLKDGVYWVKGGSGANTGFIVGKSEVVVIDSKMSEQSSREVLAEIKKITPNPVKYIVLTHGDGDHVNGLNGYPTGLPIIAHASTKRDMEEAFKDPKMSALVPFLPNKTVTATSAMTLGSVRLELLYFGPAHTSGDLVVYLPNQKIAFVGDLLFVGRDPLIHRQKGGTSFGLVQVLQKMLALDADTFLSGHADPLTKTDIRALLTSIEDKQAKVKALVAQGKSQDEVRSAMGVPAAAAGRFPSLIDIIYQEVSEKK